MITAGTWADQWFGYWAISLFVLVIGLVFAADVIGLLDCNGVKKSNDAEVLLRKHPYEVASWFWLVTLMLWMWLPECLVFIATPNGASPCAFCFGSLLIGAPALFLLLSSLPWRLYLFLRKGVYVYQCGYPPLFGLRLSGPLSEIACVYVHDTHDTEWRRRRNPRHFLVQMELSHSNSEFPPLIRWNRNKGPIIVYVSRWKQPEPAEQQAAMLRAALDSTRRGVPKTDPQIWLPPTRLMKDDEKDSKAV